MPQSKRKFPALLCIEYFNSSSEFVFARYPVRNLYLRGILFEICTCEVSCSKFGLRIKYL